ncbi:MAG TPA: hypothetical protein DCX07_12765 [Phycisphaerales bacterium]|nr:hypothetical protein [Phycisphaerales bacterium]
MNILIVFYSRTGVTRRAATELAAALGADVEEIHDTKDRHGVLGGMGGGKDALLKKLAVIEPVSRRPEEYEMVLVGTPVWAFTMAPAVRTYLAEHAAEIARAALFCTLGGSGAAKTFRDMTEMLGKPPVATLELIDRKVKAGECGEAMRQFVETIRKA